MPSCATALEILIYKTRNEAQGSTFSKPRRGHDEQPNVEALVSVNLSSPHPPAKDLGLVGRAPAPQFLHLRMKCLPPRRWESHRPQDYKALSSAWFLAGPGNAHLGAAWPMENLRGRCTEAHFIIMLYNLDICYICTFTCIKCFIILRLLGECKEHDMESKQPTWPFQDHPSCTHQPRYIHVHRPTPRPPAKQQFVLFKIEKMILTSQGFYEG